MEHLYSCSELVYCVCIVLWIDLTRHAEIYNGICMVCNFKLVDKSFSVLCYSVKRNSAPAIYPHMMGFT